MRTDRFETHRSSEVQTKQKQKSPTLMFEMLLPSCCLEAINDSFPLIRRTYSILWSLIEQSLSRQRSNAVLTAEQCVISIEYIPYALLTV